MEEGGSRRFKTPRYRGKAKVDLQKQFIGAACNVKRWPRLAAIIEIGEMNVKGLDLTPTWQRSRAQPDSRRWHLRLRLVRCARRVQLLVRWPHRANSARAARDAAEIGRRDLDGESRSWTAGALAHAITGIGSYSARIGSPREFSVNHGACYPPSSVSFCLTNILRTTARQVPDSSPRTPMFDNSLAQQYYLL